MARVRATKPGAEVGGPAEDSSDGNDASSGSANKKEATAKKRATKKKKVAKKKTATRKPAASKTAAKKKTSTRKKAASKTVTQQKPVAKVAKKKASAKKKTATSETAAAKKKTTAKKTTAKKTTAKKTTAKKTTAKKTTAKKTTTVKKSAPRKSVPPPIIDDQDLLDALRGSEPDIGALESQILASDLGEPKSREPEVREPEVREPESREPESREPEVREPEVREPEVREPEVREPESREPEVREPEVREPEVREPEVREPESREPASEPVTEAAIASEDRDGDVAEPRSGEQPTRDEQPATVYERREGYGPSPPRPNKPRRLGLKLAAVAVVVGVFVTLLPTFLLSRAQTRIEDCFAAIVKTGLGEPRACEPRSYETALALELPWLEQEASQLKVQAHYRAALLRYGLATAIAPDAEARTAAVKELRQSGDGTVAAAAPPLTALTGAFSDLTALATESDDKQLRAYAFRSARAIAALEPLRALSRGGDETEPFGLNLQRGALLCLMGDTDEGAKALRMADAAHRQLSQESDGYGRARLALLACGRGGDGLDARNVRPQYVPARTALEASMGSVEALDRARAFLDNDNPPAIGEHRLRILAFAVRDAKPGAVETLALLAPRHGPPANLDVDATRTAWLLFDADPPIGGVLNDVEAAEQAAVHMEQLLEEHKGKPLACEGDDCPVDVALTMPERLLREGARMLWFDAAVEHARRGDRDATLRTIAKASALTPERRKHQAAAVHLAVRDAAGALAILGSSSPRTAAERVRVHLNSALAHAHLGRSKKAYEQAENAFAASLSGDADGDSGGALLAREDRAAAAWMWGAMSLQVGKGSKVIPLLQETNMPKLVALSEWLQLSGQAEEERRPKRWELSMRDTPAAVLPAAMYVASRMLPEGVDVEVWLDRVFHDAHRNHPLRTMLARAEAARWRGDDAAEKLWLDRAQRMRKLVSNYPTALLAHMVELR